jgi:HTH-type transcriptional regulator/antitoxin HigA
MTAGTTRPSTYLELLQEFPPRPIRTEGELEATQAIVDELLDQLHLTEDERDYLDLLGTLIYEYEEKQVTIPDIHGSELIKALMVERDLLQKDLVSIFKTESIVSAVLSGQRNLTVNHIQKLAKFFHVSPAVFFEML